MSSSPHTTQSILALVLALALPALGGWELFRSAEPHVARGNRAMEQGRPAEALEAYQAARGSGVDPAGLDYDEGVALHALALAASGADCERGLAQAAERFRQAARATDWRLRSLASYNLGNTLVELGKEAEAMEAYKDALRADGESESARHNLELLLRKQQQQQNGQRPPPAQPQPPQQQGGQGQGQQDRQEPDAQGQEGQGSGGAPEEPKDQGDAPPDQPPPGQQAPQPSPDPAQPPGQPQPQPGQQQQQPGQPQPGQPQPQPGQPQPQPQPGQPQPQPGQPQPQPQPGQQAQPRPQPAPPQGNSSPDGKQPQRGRPQPPKPSKPERALTETDCKLEALERMSRDLQRERMRRSAGSGDADKDW